jgi:nicotinate-nucleotide adenylyltransferase
MPEGSIDADLVRLPAFQPGMRIGILGGSFDPPHRGHLAVSLVALKALALDQVWWLVSPQNPLKPTAPSKDLARRIAAARALVRHPRIHVTGIEAALGTTYTADTFRRLLPRLPGVHLVWMMGADSLAGFHHWRDWQAIAATMPLAIFNRPESALPALASPAARSLAAYRMPETAAAALAGTPAPAWVFLSRPHVPLSSTALRAAASKTKSTS